MGGVTSQDVGTSGEHGTFVVVAVAFTIDLVVMLTLCGLKASHRGELCLRKHCRDDFVGDADAIFRGLGRGGRVRTINGRTTVKADHVGSCALSICCESRGTLRLGNIASLLKGVPRTRGRVVIRRSCLRRLKLPIRLSRAIALSVPFKRGRACRIYNVVRDEGTSHVCRIVMSSSLCDQCKGTGDCSLLIHLGGARGVSDRALGLLVGRVTRRDNMPRRCIVCDSACFKLTRRGSARRLLIVVKTDDLVMLTYSLIVCDLFCVSIVKGARRCNELHILKTASIRVGHVIQGRDFLLSYTTVPVNIMLKDILNCYFIPSN